MPSAVEVIPTPAPELVAAVDALLPGVGALHWEALAGGVSSDIWRIEGASGVYCVKRALPRLKVAADWFAPVRRNREEVKWLRFAATAVPGHVPGVVGADPERGVAILEWFDPSVWQPWKTQLLAGQVRAGIGTDMGRLLATIHNASAATPGLAAEFDNLDLLDALRLEPYFGATALVNRDVADVLTSIRNGVATHRTALVHGDVSPKNILVHAARGPLLLDAECACWADPAFDVAFLASHLFLKAAHLSPFRQWFYETIRRFLTTYADVAAEPVDARARLLIPALMLARIDGKSPVEYLKEDMRRTVRTWVKKALLTPYDSCDAFLGAWRKDFYR